MLSAKQHEQKVRDAIRQWAGGLGLPAAVGTQVADVVFAQRRELVGILQGGAGQPAFEPSARSEKALGKYTGGR